MGLADWANLTAMDAWSSNGVLADWANPVTMVDAGSTFVHYLNEYKQSLKSNDEYTLKLPYNGLHGTIKKSVIENVRHMEESNFSNLWKVQKLFIECVI